jgi:CheY-like chemotaxis protein
MSSAVKQLLGTETVHALRARGFDTITCGLSANDVEKAFLKFGANSFVMKPLPTEKRHLTNVLFQVLDSAGNHKKHKAANPLSVPSFSPKISIADGKPDDEDGCEVLPKKFSVLFVDDDEKLRGLFSRSLKRAMPTWTIQQAAEGEAALELTKTSRFDLIFLDQYMPSKNKTKPLLGTETTYALRANGVTSLICGLSANDARDTFLEAGANCFYMKPFPCDKEELIRELVLILASHDNYTQPIRVPGEVFLAQQLLPDIAEQSNGMKSPVDVAYSPRSLKSQREIDEEKLENVPMIALLPENVSVLYVDDSRSLRKMFSRSVKMATKGWNIREAESRDAALELVDSDHFDVIFLDQHLEGSELGTNIAKALRDRGVDSIICGLSADDIKSSFFDAGASCFIMKPFPCEKSELIKQLSRVLASARLNAPTAESA